MKSYTVIVASKGEYMGPWNNIAEIGKIFWIRQASQSLTGTYNTYNHAKMAEFEIG